MLDTANTAPNIKGIYVDGQWRQTARQFDDVNPSDDTLWARIPDATGSDTARAIEAAAKAFPSCKIAIPSLGLYRAVINRATPSAAGPDGVPLRAWETAGDA